MRWLYVSDSLQALQAWELFGSGWWVQRLEFQQESVGFIHATMQVYSHILWMEEILHQLVTIR